MQYFKKVSKIKFAEERRNLYMSKYKIGIVVTWFGNLPSYFSAWLRSVEENPDIDFLVFCDHEFERRTSNVKFYRTTLEESIKYFEKKLKRKINIKNSYKFCDCRAFFGITYEEYLKEYDFWGYCDIDLMFGNIRGFLTDEILEKYDRFYQYGHLCVFRNVERINHLHELPGSIYKLDEVFCGKAKTTFEEYFGLNRICEKNNIAWYTNVDFVDFNSCYCNRMEICHKIKNYDEQIFMWHDGHAYRVYKDNEVIKMEEYIYMHWQKKKPVIEGEIMDDSYLIITENKIVAVNDESIMSNISFETWNPIIDKRERKICMRNYYKKKLKEFQEADFATKQMWIRQMFYRLYDSRKYM